MPIIGRILVLVGLFFLGSIASTRVESLLACKDPSQIVIDELVGMWLVFLPFNKISFTEFVLGFILFRLFDIFKPWPIKASEKWTSSGFSIMIDDVLAGLMAMLCLFLIQYIIK